MTRCFGAVALVMLTTCPAWSGQSEAMKSVTLSGRVVAPDGAPVEGARIIVRQRPDGLSGSWRTGYLPVALGSEPLLTDSEGGFATRFSLPEKGGFVVAVEKSGWVGALVGPIRTERFNSEPLDGIVLRKLRSVEGRVLDRQGRPVAGAEVFQTGNTHERTSAISDAEGRFRLERLPDGQSAIFVRKAGFRFHGQFIQASDKSVSLTIARESEPVAGLRTLPTQLTRQQERDLCKSLVEPVWRKAVESGERVEIFRAGYAYAHVDPWEVVEADKNSFLHIALYRRYRESPEDTLALIESASEPEAKCRVYLGLAEYSRASGMAGSLDLLDRALRHAMTIGSPEIRCYFISGIAIQLHELGQTNQSSDLITRLQSDSEHSTQDVARRYVAEALARIDPQGALQMVAAIRDQDQHEQASLRIAWWLADRDPALADAVFRGANRQSLLMDILRRLGLSQRVPLCSLSDRNSAAICYRMAKLDPVRAIAIARRQQERSMRAYALGVTASVLTATDRPAARRLLAEAFAELEATDLGEPDLAAPDSPYFVDATAVAGSLLFVAEEIDPALVTEYLWRTVAMRAPLNTADFTMLHANDAGLMTAAAIARYDRVTAAEMLRPYRDRFLSGFPIGSPWFGIAVAFVAPEDALRVSAALPARTKDEPVSADQTRFCISFATVLAVPEEQRWSLVPLHSGLWRPEEEAMSHFAWGW